jgi:hypothetical protein
LVGRLAFGRAHGLAHGIALPLCTEVGSEALLRKLKGALVLPDAEEFDDAALVRGETSDFGDDGLDDLGARGHIALPERRCAQRRRALRHNVAFGASYCDAGHSWGVFVVGQKDAQWEDGESCWPTMTMAVGRKELPVRGSSNPRR